LTTPSQPDLQVFAFGPPLLVVDSEKKQFNQRGGIRRMPEFLLYLIVVGQNGGCRWSDVCAALWPEEEPEKASILFHQHLKRLRKSVLENADYIVLLNDYYQVNADYLSWCDALVFDTLYERAIKASPDDALPLWLELITLYRGDFLAGFELGEWGTVYRTSYEDRFLQAVELAGERLLQNNIPGEALIIVQKGLSQDYFRETLHRRALLAYAQLGMYDNLSAHYHELNQTFVREFNAHPESETIRLYEQLVKNR
jgi:two-component SAPR family response regulator